MPSKKKRHNSLLENLRRDFPELVFLEGPKYSFRPPRTIYIKSDFVAEDSEPLILHEVAHAKLGHRTFRTDVERLKMETEAWEEARKLAKRYSVEMSEDLIQGELDTYRDWLYSKSKCKKCGSTRYQTPDGKYTCPICEQ